MTDLISSYETWARVVPKHPAIITGDTTFSYARLWEVIEQQCDALRSFNVGPGEVFILSVETQSIEWIVGLLSALRAGVRLILPDTVWSQKEFNALTGKMNPAGEIVWKKGLHIERYSGSNVSDKSHSAFPGVWLYTSGTTETPRPYFRSVMQLGQMVNKLASRIPKDILSTTTRSLCVLPLYHGFGLINSLLLVHSKGGAVVIPAGMDGKNLNTQIAAHQVNVIYAWPAHYELLNASYDPATKSKNLLQWCVSSSFRLDPSVADTFYSNYGCPIRHQYGMTETGPLCLNSEDPRQLADNCVGRPIDGVEVAILNNAARRVDTGKEGSIAVRLDSGEVEGLESAVDGFQFTGDIGHLDDYGRLYVHGRVVPFSDERKEA